MEKLIISTVKGGLKMKLMVMGYGRHGKDTVCEILKEKYGMTFKSSSLSRLRNWLILER